MPGSNPIPDTLFIRFFSLTALLLMLVSQVHPFDIYQTLRVYGTDKSTLDILHNVGIPLDHVRIKKGVFIDVIASSEQLELLEQTGLTFDVLIDDMTRYFLERNIPDVKRDFELGSMLGNYTYSEIEEKMVALASSYPAIVSVKDSIGTSIEGRTIWAFKVSDNPDQNESEPEILYTGLTHAREPLGMMNQFYFVQWLCENYNVDSVAQYLVDERELWFIPVINPDGYVYNESIAPNGGGMHRKNRLDTGCGTNTQRGVDLNRNYGYDWGADNSGSSPNPCSATFRGDSAFSEPETQAVKDFILAHEFSNVLHYHSYSNVLIHSWGDGSLPDEPDLTTLREIGWEMTKFNGYGVGTGNETIGYGVNGDAVDWTYGSAGLISYTPEVGSFQDGFWPSENRVIPLCQDQLYANQVFGLVGGADYILYEADASNVQGDTIHLAITIQNRGLMDSDGNVIIDLQPYGNLGSFIQFDNDIGGLPARSSKEIERTLILPDTVPDGTEVGFIISISDNSSFVRVDTFTVITGSPSLLFIEDAETDLSNWTTTGTWGIVLSNPNTGNHSITDSPAGNYTSNISSSIMLNAPFSFTAVDYPFARFTAKWDIENNWDFVRFQLSTDGSQWTSLEGLYTESGAGQGTQNPGEQGYDWQSDWVEEFVDLSAYTEESQIYFRFILTSDGYLNEDGFYFDDFRILGYPNFLPGDMDGDEQQTIFDVLAIVDLIFSEDELNTYQIMMGDVNFDGQVTIIDALVLVNIILQD